MRDLQAKDIALMGISVALMIVVGQVLYQVSQLLPIPASRVVITAPVFGFILTLACLFTRKIGTVSLISIAYGIYVFIRSGTPFSMISIIGSGILCDLITLVFFRNYDTDNKILFSVPIRSVLSIWTSFFVVTLMVPQSRFVQAGVVANIITSIIVYLIGLLAAKLCIRLFADKMRPRVE